MFGARSLGSSLLPRPRTFAGRGAVAGQVVVGGTQLDYAGIGMVQGNERFVPGVRQPGQFVGADAADVPSFLTDVATASALPNQYRGRYLPEQRYPDGQRVNPVYGQWQPTAPQVRYRVSHNVGFNYNVPSSSALESQLASRLQRLPEFRAVEVTLDQRTVVLRGSVATPHERDLAETMMRLEAGVDNVQNQLAVSPASAN
jgi:hypothetical protein